MGFHSIYIYIYVTLCTYIDVHLCFLLFIWIYQLLSRNSFINTRDDNAPLVLLEMTFLSSLSKVAIFELVVFKKVQVTLGKFTTWPWKIPMSSAHK